VTPVLEVAGVTKGFGGNHVLQGISLAVEQGELVALVGPNGAGKTTLLNVLSGQFRPDAGRITFDGEDVTGVSPAHRRRHAMVRSYQDGGVFGDLTTLENVMVSLIARGVRRPAARAAAADVVQRLGLERVLHEPAKRLSGGQRKLVDFGRLLVVDARLQLLDEPTAGVLPAMCDQMSTALRERRDAGVASLIISHDLPWALDVCTRVVVLARGSVLADGTPEAVRADPSVREAYLA
jgi:ABC-type branched-subunit amino acid transport system ATPase component